MNKLGLILFGLLFGALALPTTFDIRYQPQNSIYANFQTSPDYICESYTWGKQIAQILSNKASIDKKTKITLSTQHIAECTNHTNDMCKETSLQNIQKAIQLIRDQGLIEQDCYPNNLYELPSRFCRKNCTDGQQFVRRFRAQIVNYQISDLSKLLQSIGNGKTFGFAVINYYEDMNYYSPSSSQMKHTGELYTYRIAEIVGWRKGGQQINLRIGASGWGYKGYGFVPKNSPIIAKLYSIAVLESVRAAQQ